MAGKAAKKAVGNNRGSKSATSSTPEAFSPGDQVDVQVDEGKPWRGTVMDRDEVLADNVMVVPAPYPNWVLVRIPTTGLLGYMNPAVLTRVDDA